MLSTLGPEIKPLFAWATMLLYYAIGVLMALNLWSAASLSGGLEWGLLPAKRLIRWMGMLTFALYLGHRPLLNFFAAWPLEKPGHLLQTAWLLGGTFAVCVGLAHVGEILRPILRRTLHPLLTALGRELSARKTR